MLVLSSPTLFFLTKFCQKNTCYSYGATYFKEIIESPLREGMHTLLSIFTGADGVTCNNENKVASVPAALRPRKSVRYQFQRRLSVSQSRLEVNKIYPCPSQESNLAHLFVSYFILT